MDLRWRHCAKASPNRRRLAATNTEVCWRELLRTGWTESAIVDAFQDPSEHHRGNKSLHQLGQNKVGHMWRGHMPATQIGTVLDRCPQASKLGSRSPGLNLEFMGGSKRFRTGLTMLGTSRLESAGVDAFQALFASSTNTFAAAQWYATVTSGLPGGICRPRHGRRPAFLNVTCVLSVHDVKHVKVEAQRRQCHHRGAEFVQSPPLPLQPRCIFRSPQHQSSTACPSNDSTGLPSQQMLWIILYGRCK